MWQDMEDIIGDVGRILLEYLAIDIGISWQFSPQTDAEK